MKHNTHIYLAAKGIEFLYEGLNNLQYASTHKKAASTTIAKYRQKAKVLQQLLMHYQDMITEASWAPDDILNDKSQYHTFKLYTEAEFPGAASLAKESYRGCYYRASGGGGLPYKVDHLARVISDMNKLRGYNDRCSMNQIMYQFLMISHYIVDAHVPMHCDIRDDPPSESDTGKPRNGNYYSDDLHGLIEQIWEDAVTPVAIEEGILKVNRLGDGNQPNELSKKVRFNVINKTDCGAIVPYVIPDDDLMGYMIDLCIQTKEHALQMFPVGTPSDWNQTAFPEMTRTIFARTISNLISVWIWIWCRNNE